MNVPLASPRARAVLLLCSCGLALLLTFFGLRNAVAAHDQGLDTRQGYERAVRLEPQNARNWYLLGRSYLYDVGDPEPARAGQALRKAVALDPYSAEALLDLASAYDGEGNGIEARAAFIAAQRVYPLSAEVAWSYGNFLLRQGENDAALAQLRKALEVDPQRSAEAFSRVLSAVPDLNKVLDIMVPATPEAYLPILQLLSAPDSLADAELVWYRLVALRPKVPMREMVPFFDALIRGRRPDDAARLWSQAASIMQNPPPPDPPNSLLWDGGFESGYSGGGFSWTFTSLARDVQIGWDRSQKHSGEQSMRILFNGRENLRFSDLCHQFVPEGGQHYLLSAWVKTQALSSSEGIRLEIHAFSGAGTVLAESDEIHGTQDWQELQLRWDAPPDSGFGNVCIARNMSDKPGSDIQGAAWIDDVLMIPFEPAVSGAPAKP